MNRAASHADLTLLIILTILCSHHSAKADFNPFFTGRFSFLALDPPTQPSTQSAWQRFLEEHNRRNPVRVEKVLKITPHPTLPLWEARLSTTTTKKPEFKLPNRPATTTNSTIPPAKRLAPKYFHPQFIYQPEEEKETTTPRGAQLLQVIEDEVQNRITIFRKGESINLPRMFGTIPPDDAPVDDKDKLINVNIKAKSYWYIALIVGLLGCAVFIVGALTYQKYRAKRDQDNQKIDKLVIIAEANMVQSKDNIQMTELTPEDDNSTRIDIAESLQADEETIEDTHHVSNSGMNDVHVTGSTDVNQPQTSKLSLKNMSYTEIALNLTKSDRSQSEQVSTKDYSQQPHVSPVHRRDSEIIFYESTANLNIPQQSQTLSEEKSRVNLDMGNENLPDQVDMGSQPSSFTMITLPTLEDGTNNVHRPRSMSTASVQHETVNPPVQHQTVTPPVQDQPVTTPKSKISTRTNIPQPKSKMHRNTESKQTKK